MNILERKRKYPALENLGFTICARTDRPAVDWVPAHEVEKLFAGHTVPVFTKKDPVLGRFVNWSTIDSPEDQFMGFVVGPYEIPDYEGRPGGPKTETPLQADRVVEPHKNAGALVGLNGEKLEAQESVKIIEEEPKP